MNTGLGGVVALKAAKRARLHGWDSADGKGGVAWHRRDGSWVGCSAERGEENEGAWPGAGADG